MRYRIRVITLMAIAVAVFLFTIWMTSPQEVSGEVNSFTAKTMNAVGDMEVAPVQPQEQENPLGEPFLIRCTCYTWTGNQWDRNVRRLCLHPGGGCRRINKKRERVAHVLKWAVSNLANCKLPA